MERTVENIQQPFSDDATSFVGNGVGRQPLGSDAKNKTGVTDEMSQLGTVFYNQVTYDYAAKGSLKNRWDQTERVYLLDQNEVGGQGIQGFEPIAVPAARNKTRQLNGKLVTGITSPSPLAQIIPYGENQNDDEQERALEFAIDKSGFVGALAPAIHHAIGANLAFLRVGFKEKHGQFHGLKTDWFTADEVVIYPNTVEKIENAETVGVRFYMTKRDIIELQEEGIYRDVPVWSELASPLDKENIDSKLTQTYPVEMVDGMIEMYQLYRWFKVGGEWVYMMFDFAYKSRQILRAQVCPIQRPVFAPLRLLRTQKRLYSDDSIGFSGKGINLAMSDLFTAAVGGTYATASPPVFITGANGLGNNFKYGPGQAIPIDGFDVKVTVVESRFNGGGLLQMVEVLDHMLDGVYGLSSLGTSEALPSGTTATAINTMNMADGESERDYMESLAEGLEDYVEIFRTYLRDPNIHALLQSVWGDGIAVKDIAVFGQPCTIKLSAATGSGTVNQTLQKLDMVMRMTSDPRSLNSYSRAEAAIIGQMDLPMGAKTLQKDWVSEATEMLNKAEQAGLDPQEIINIGMQELIAQKQAEAHGVALAQHEDQNGGLGQVGGIGAGAANGEAENGAGAPVGEPQYMPAG